MPVDSRAKGARGEYLVRDMLREASGLQFERVPSSGALSYLKGDLFVPHEINRFCIEVKNYEESPLNDKIFTNKSNYIVKWWDKLLEQAAGGKQEPLLIFKYNRSKVFVITELEPENTEKYMFISWLNCYVMLITEWLAEEEIRWLNPFPNK
jgi:Holliday junction resolvase